MRRRHVCFRRSRRTSGRIRGEFSKLTGPAERQELAHAVGSVAPADLVGVASWIMAAQFEQAMRSATPWKIRAWRVRTVRHEAWAGRCLAAR